MTSELEQRRGRKRARTPLSLTTATAAPSSRRRRRPLGSMWGCFFGSVAAVTMATTTFAFQPLGIPFHRINTVSITNQFSRQYMTNEDDTMSFPNELDNFGVGTASMEMDVVNGEMSGGAIWDDPTEEDYEVAICAVDWDNPSAPYVSRMDSESTFVDFTEDGLVVPAGPVGQFKEDLANILDEPIVEIMIAISVLLNSLLVALSTLDVLGPYISWIRNGELLVSLAFALDFAGRWFSSCKDPGRHVLNAQFVVDVLVVILPLLVGITPSSVWVDTPLPSWLTSPSGLFNLELLRVLRLRRVLQDLPTLERFVERAFQGIGVQETKVDLVQDWQLQLARVLLSLFTLVSVATGLIYTAENQVNPAINNYFDALYFGLTTLTTVGFGDISPITWQGKLIVCGSILVGVAVVPAQAAALVEALLEREDNRKRTRQRSAIVSRRNRNNPSTAATMEDANGAGASVLGLDTSKQCPECGATFHWVGAQFCYSCGEPIE